MDTQMIWLLLVLSIILVMLFGNKKVRVFSVFGEQFHVFKNAKTGKHSIWDITCFVILPIVLSVVFVTKLHLFVGVSLAELLTTVFAMVFTILFGFASILIGKIESSNSIEKQVAGETFVSIVTATLLSLIATIVSIIITQIDNDLHLLILSAIIYSISFMEVMLLLLITKRTFVIYHNSVTKDVVIKK